MPSYNPKLIRGRNLKAIRGGGSFLLGNTLGGLQSVGEEQSAYNGQGLSSINQKLEKLMVKINQTQKYQIFNVMFRNFKF